MYQQQCENTQHSEGKTSPMFCFLVIARQQDHRGLALTAACRDLTTDISQPLVNTLLSPGSICSPFLCPLAPIMKPRTSHLKYSLSLTFSSPWALHRYRLRVYFQGRDLRGFDNRSWRIHASISHVFLPPFKLHETLQPWNAMYTSKQQRRKLVKVMLSV